jgi:hypothetical protein
MDEPQTTTPALRLERIDLWIIGLLALLTLGLRVVQIATTEVTARDSITYIHIAWQLEHGDWRQVIPAARQHPGYPVALLAASMPVRLFFPSDLAYAMQLAAQVASASASILLVAPLYWLGRELFHRRAAFGAVLIFQCLPCSGRIMADGLSEGVFLLFAVTALALATASLRTGSILGFALSGASGGLAYLTRPEGLVIPAAAGLTLLAVQLFARWRRPWRRVLACGAALAIAALIVSGPYMVLIRGLTVKNTGNYLMQEPVARIEPPTTGAQPCATAVSAVLSNPITADTAVAHGRGPVFAVWWYGHPSDTAGRALWGLETLGEVLGKAFFFVFWVPALAGLAFFHRVFRTHPGAWMVLLVCAILAYLLYRVACGVGYLSDRHSILILACGVLWAAAALDAAGAWAAGLLTRARPTAAGNWWADGRAWAAALLVVAAAAPLARTLEPLHGDRGGFRIAGQWLAAHADPGDQVFDPFGWAAYYAGRDFRMGEPQNVACNYVVLEAGAKHPSHLASLNEANEAAKTGSEKCRFPAGRGADGADVVVYKLPKPWVTPPLP